MFTHATWTQVKVACGAFSGVPFAANLAKTGITVILINLRAHFLCPNGRMNVFPWAIGLIPFLSPQRLLALLTGVLYVCLICSGLFLKICLGKMAECMEFQDYLQAGVHDSVREGTPAASWAKAKMRLTKSLRHLGDSRSQWL